MPKEFKVGFVGSSHFIPILAENERHAKKIFADLNFTVPSSYIVVKRK